MSIELHGGVFLRASRDAVWAGLHDVDLLAACLPGCRSLRRASDRGFAISLGVQPLGLAFHGMVRIDSYDPPRSYRLVGWGDGGRAGTAAGHACIALYEENGGCRLRYSIRATTDGLVLALGSMVLTGAGRGLTTIFARRLVEHMGERRPVAA